jgi:GDP-mannose 6-dehydrogenase
MKKKASETQRPANVSVFGMGYVGTVTAACLARDGHSVTGVDVHPLKLAMFREGKSPIIEPDLPELVAEVVAAGRLRVTSEHKEAVFASDVSLVCVGTPSAEDGGLDLRYVREVARQIGSALRRKDEYHTVIIRSTMLPGSTESEVLPVLETASGKQAGRDFGLCVNPEFMREGSSVEDFDHPPLTLIGALDERSGDAAAALYAGLKAPLIRTDLRTAEMAKYVSNSWHALKIAFANEIGNFCKRAGVDGHRVMEIFAQDTKLNISAAYLKPGFAYGGSCLPKDVRALLHRARSEHLEMPVLEAIPRSNELQARTGVEMVMRTGKKRVGVLGFSFKENSDDLRESPMMGLIETLIGKGYDIQVYDPNVSLDLLMGATKRYVERTVPHIACLMSDDLRHVIERSEVLVVGKRSPEFSHALGSLDGNKRVVDLVRVFADPSRLDGAYEGICW